MNTRSMFFVLLSLLFGVGAVLLAQSWLKQRQPSDGNPNQSIVVTMAVNVPAGTVLETRHLTVQPIPNELVPEDAVTSTADVVDKVAKFPMIRGDILHPDKLAERGEGSVLASLIEPHKRAVTIRVNDVVGVAGFLLPGNRVDVLVTYRVGNQRVASSEAVTEVVVSNLKVLAVDQKVDQETNQPLVVRAVTLEVSLEEAENLMSARSKGNIQLALRNPTDDSQIELAQHKPEPAEAEVKPDKAEPELKKSSPAQPYKRKIEVIRGTSQQTVSVES